MKKLVIIAAMVMVVGVVGVANADLTKIGTASYQGDTYNLIYEDDQELVWLDYTKMPATWYSQMVWAAGLGGDLIVSLFAGYSTTIDWTAGWRLPSADVNPQGGEMGHLYYSSLGKPYGGPLGDTDPFVKLQATSYWSGSGHPSGEDWAWIFSFHYGTQMDVIKVFSPFYAVAVHPGVVSAPLPEPSTMLLLGSGLIGLLGFRKKFKK